jgi:hypothetical protein
LVDESVLGYNNHDKANTDRFCSLNKGDLPRVVGPDDSAEDRQCPDPGSILVMDSAFWHHDEKVYKDVEERGV